jgi:hypothetical protein
MAQRRHHSDQALALLYHARSATPFLSDSGRPCASVPSSVESCRVLPLRSADFRDWLTANYYSEFETAPSSLALRAAIRTLEARARYGDSPAKKVDHRLSFEGDPFAPSKIFIDLANREREILEVTSQSWSICSNLRQCFQDSPGMLPLPNPQPLIPNSLLKLSTLFNKLSILFNLSNAALTRMLIWLVSALRPMGPYPILVIRGPAASGKSTLARSLRTLIDPSAAPLRPLPTRDREVVKLGRDNWILAFDDVHRIPLKISEALCAVSSGVAVESAQPDYRDSALAEIARPIILIAPSDESESWRTPSRALSNRSLAIELAHIAEPRPRAALWSDFEALRAPALAVLADAVSCALRNIREMDLAQVARFPDCLAWSAAAAPVLGINPEAIVEAVSDPGSMWLAGENSRHKTPKHASRNDAASA